MRARVLIAAAGALLTLHATGCIPSARDPLRVLPLERTGSDTLVVLLPGRFDDADDFRKRRFAEIAREEGATFDVTAVDAHLGYYAGGSVAERLEDDVVLPARRAGYRRVWLAGISMGGLGAVIYAERYPSGVDGIFLIAPYLGEAEAAEAVLAAGGLAAWTPPPVAPEEMEFSERIWASAREVVEGDTVVLLAFGTADDLAPQHEVLAAALPDDRVDRLPGGHEWKPWLQAWRRFAASGIATSAAASP